MTETKEGKLSRVYEYVVKELQGYNDVDWAISIKYGSWERTARKTGPYHKSKQE